MKIAFIGQKGVPATVGGVETHVQRLALGLHKKGHDVYVYTRPWYVNNLRQKKFNGIKIIYKGSIKTKNFDTISHVFLASLDALRRDFDIIHYHGVGPALLSWIPRLFKPSAKVVTTFHCLDRKHLKWGFLARGFLSLGEWFAVKFAHETITVSKVLQRYCQKKYHVKTIYVPNGIDLPKTKSAQLIKKKYGLEKGEYILFLSRLIKHKGAHYLIDAYNKLKTNKKLIIAGGGAFTDSYVKELEREAVKNPNIILAGEVKVYSDLWRELFSNAYLFVLPSETEGLPIVILEAMSFGRCVLASDILENQEALSGGFGFKFKNKSSNDLARKLQYLLTHPATVAKIGQASREHVKQNYNWKDIVRVIEKIYDSLLEKESSQTIKKELFFQQKI